MLMVSSLDGRPRFARGLYTAMHTRPYNTSLQESVTGIRTLAHMVYTIGNPESLSQPAGLM